MAAFLDVEGAFDNARFTSMRRAMRSRGFSKSIIDWIEEMLSKREISAYLGDSVVRVRAVQGCPQGGVISPLLWSLVVDDLLIKLQYQGFEVIGFADDIIIIVRGKYDAIVSDRMQSALSYTLRSEVTLLARERILKFSAIGIEFLEAYSEYRNFQAKSSSKSFLEYFVKIS